jgi:16S rRNA (uracil1498-N3)-methyltransferase
VLVDPDAVDAGRVVLDADDSHHLTRVLRRRAGAPVSVADGAGRVWQGEIAESGPPVVVALGGPVEVPPPQPAMTVVHALPTAGKLDEVVRRLSELGVDRLQPVVSARAENRPRREKAAKQARRWAAVARATAKQARRARPLEIDDVAAWPGRLPDAPAGAVLWEEADTRLTAVLGEVGAADSVALGVGPEGGLTADEVSDAGLPAAALGDTILRTETAAVAAGAVVLHRAGRFA